MVTKSHHETISTHFWDYTTRLNVECMKKNIVLFDIDNFICNTVLEEISPDHIFLW